MPGRLRPGPLPVLRGERVILRERRESDIGDRLRYPIDPGEEDGHGSSWRRDQDGRRYHTREHLAAGQGPAEPGNYRWALEHEGHCTGSAGLRAGVDQHCATYNVCLLVPGLRGQGLGREITRLVLA
jgi:RimJ/RimL family protein N-acetyltransferase